MCSRGYSPIDTNSGIGSVMSKQGCGRVTSIFRQILVCANPGEIRPGLNSLSREGRGHPVLQGAPVLALVQELASCSRTCAIFFFTASNEVSCSGPRLGDTLDRRLW